METLAKLNICSLDEGLRKVRDVFVLPRAVSLGPTDGGHSCVCRLATPAGGCSKNMCAGPQEKSAQCWQIFLEAGEKACRSVRETARQPPPERIISLLANISTRWVSKQASSGFLIMLSLNTNFSTVVAFVSLSSILFLHCAVLFV